FEPGKRVPGAAASGSAWAAAATRVSPTPALGVLATLALGACALVPAGERRMAAAPALPLALSLGAASWGVYATLAAPEAGLAGAAVAAPRLAGAEGARIGPWPASVVGGVAGAAVFAGLVALGARLPGPAASLREVPVLAAAPAAWLVVKVLRRAAAGAS